MTLEFLAISATLAGGAVLLRMAGLRGWGLLPLGMIVGTSVLTIIGTAQVALWLPSSPALAYACLALPLLWWGWQLTTGMDVRVAPWAVLTTAAGLLALVALFRAVHLVNVTPDSYNLLMTGALMAGGHVDAGPAGWWENWQAATGVIHGLGALQGELYLRSATPILAVATLGALIWLINQAAEPLGRPLVWLLAGAGGMLLATTPRFLYHAFYMNRHMLVGALLLLSAAAVWGLMRGHIAAPPILLTILLTTLPALVVARGETPVVAGFVLVVLLTSDTVDRRYRALAASVTGAAILLWYAPLAMRYLRAEMRPSTVALAMVILGAGVLATAIVVQRRWSWADPLPRWTVSAGEVGLWVVLAGFAVTDPELLAESIWNTAKNVVLQLGGWGMSLTLVALMGLLVLFAVREDDRTVLRFPVTAFIPYALILAYVRAPEGLAYRAGTGDSLNRMLFHFVPLVILYIATSPMAAHWRRHADALTEGADT